MKYLSKWPPCHLRANTAAQGPTWTGFCEQVPTPQSGGGPSVKCGWISKTFPFVSPTQWICSVPDKFNRSQTKLWLSLCSFEICTSGCYLRWIFTCLCHVVNGAPKAFLWSPDLIRPFQPGASDKVPFRLNRVTEIVKNCLQHQNIEQWQSISYS